MEIQKPANTERTSKLEAIGNSLKNEMRSLSREPAVIIFHPSRLPNRAEFESLFAISGGNAVEHDIRAGKEGYSIQQGMFTDRLKAWSVVNNIGEFKIFFGDERASEIIKIVKERTDTREPVTIDTVKTKLFVKDLTLSELEAFASVGGEQIIGIKSFLDLYQRATENGTAPGRLSADIKDGDMSISGGADKAVEATKVLLEELKVRNLENSLYMVMQYNIPSLMESRRLLPGHVQSVGIISSDIIKKEGEPAFYAYAAKMMTDTGTEWIGTKAAELRIVQELINAKRPNMMVYVPPKESADLPYLVNLLRDYPNIKAIQIDA